MADYVEASFKLVNGKGKETFTINGKTYEREVNTSSLPPSDFVDFEDGSWTQVAGEPSKYSEHSNGFNNLEGLYGNLGGIFNNLSGGLFGFGIGGPGDFNPESLKSMIDEVAGAIGLNDTELDDISQSVKTLVDKVRSSEDAPTTPKAYQYEDIECDCDDCLDASEEYGYCCEECSSEYVYHSDEKRPSIEKYLFTGVVSECPKCSTVDKHFIKYYPATTEKEYFERTCKECGFTYKEETK